MGEDRCCGKCLFKCFESRSALIGEVPDCTLLGKVREGYGDFRVSINEMSVEVGKTEEQLNVINLSRFRAILDNLDFVWCHGKAFG